MSVACLHLILCAAAAAAAPCPCRAATVAAYQELHAAARAVAAVGCCRLLVNELGAGRGLLTAASCPGAFIATHPAWSSLGWLLG